MAVVFHVSTRRGWCSEWGRTGGGVELLGDGGGVVLELLEQVRRDGQEVDTGKSLDLASLQSGK